MTLLLSRITKYLDALQVIFGYFWIITFDFNIIFVHIVDIFFIEIQMKKESFRMVWIYCTVVEKMKGQKINCSHFMGFCSIDFTFIREIGKYLKFLCIGIKILILICKRNIFNEHSSDYMQLSAFSPKRFGSL